MASTELRVAAQKALEALELGYDSAKAEADQYHAAMAGYRPQRHAQMDADVQQIATAITALRAALAEPEGGGNLPPPLPVEFDHGIGADRFRVVRGAYWWHVLIGESTAKHGKFHTQAGAEEMAALLLREFRNGAFVQHEAALVEPVQEPVAWRFEARHIDSAWAAAVTLKHPGPEGVYMRNVVPLYTAPPQRKPEPNSDYERGFVDGMSEQARRSVDKAVNAMTECRPLAEEEIARLVTNDMVKFARAIERAHGIGEQQ